MKRKTSKVLLLIFIVMAAALCGCMGDKQENTTSSHITIGIPQDLENSLDPHKAVGAGTKEVLFNVFEGLVKPDSQGNIVPALANYEISEEGKVYTFTLKDEVFFHDGSQVTVEDIKYSIDKCADTSKGDLIVSAFSNIEEVNILNESQVEIRLGIIDTDFLASVATVTAAIIPANNQNLDSVPIGTGPYQYVSRSPQENIILKRFDEYWGEVANIEDVILKVCTNTDTWFMELQSGAVDMFARMPIVQAQQITEGFHIYEGSMNLVQAVYINHENEILANADVRRALSLATNKEEILTMVSDGKGVEIASSMFPAFEKYYDEELNSIYPYDVERAKELMEEVGYAEGFSITITVPSNYAQHVDTAQVIAEQWKAINVTVNIELIEWESWLSDVYSNRNYEATIIGVDAASLTASALLERFSTESASNFINFSNNMYDEKFTLAMAETDDTIKTQYYKECLEILTNEAANVYIQDIAELVILNEKYAGYEFYPLYVQDIAKLYIVE